MKWWHAWFAAAAAAIVLPWPWSVAVGAPFAVYAGWNLIPATRECGWCGRRHRGRDWCCNVCAQWHSDTPGWDAVMEDKV